jgi:orotate phosphoribosyltransferase
MQAEVLELLTCRKGHFLFESGHHGNLWLDLEGLCLEPRKLKPLTGALAEEIAGLRPDVICSPLVEGAFVGLLVAMELGVQFTYTERHAQTTVDGLFPAGYRIPAARAAQVRGRRVAIVNDVINAGSAVRGTFSHLKECGATIVGIGALLVLGEAASKFADAESVALKTLAAMPNHLWAPSECPLCHAGEPLEDVADFRRALDTKT